MAHSKLSMVAINVMGVKRLLSVSDTSTVVKPLSEILFSLSV